MVKDEYLSIKSRIETLRDEFSTNSHVLLNSVDQYADIIYRLSEKHKIEDRYKNLILRYLTFLESDFESEKMDQMKAKCLYPIVDYLSRSHGYYRGGWQLYYLLLGVLSDLTLHFMGLLHFIHNLPAVTLALFAFKIGQFLYKKRQGKVLLELS